MDSPEPSGAGTQIQRFLTGLRKVVLHTVGNIAVIKEDVIMLTNINYNIMETITIVSKSLYRYDAYVKDASQCESCRNMWLAFRKQREAELATLLIELKKHIGEQAVTEPVFPERFEWTQSLI